MEDHPILPEEQEIPTAAAAKPEPPAYSAAALQWLLALPEAPDLADPFGLDEGDFAIRCVRELLQNRPFELPLQAQHVANSRLHHFYFESRNREKVFGTRNLGIGYPFVLCKLDNYEVCAPLFIHQFALEPHAQYTDRWQVIHNEQHLIFPNYPLFHLVDYVYGTNFSEKTRTLAEKKQLDDKALTSLADQLCKQLGITEDGLSLSVQPFPDETELPGMMAEGRLRWSALAGIYPTLPKTVMTQAPVVAPNLPADLEWRHAITQLTLDASQRETLLAVQKNAMTVVEGASGTGKTYMLAAIAINALSNGKKCLVVSKSLAALRRAQKFIVDQGFGDLSFVLRDIYSDKLMLADMLRMASDNKQRPAFNEEQYKSVLNRVIREEDKLDTAWEAVHTPIFGDWDFNRTVGVFLEANRKEGKELLFSQLQPSDFVFSKDEYDEILGAIQSSQPLFQRFPTLDHPLNNLNANIFLQHDPNTGLEHSQILAASLLEKATDLHHRFIVKTNEYTESLTEHYESHFEELDRQVKSIRDGLEDGTHRFGADFEKSVSVTEKLYGVFLTITNIF
ncbi:MAG: PhoH family protein [Lewinellaceae bacterium]|nr:PhoH family protein [Lewinellaceae bacterium]